MELLTFIPKIQFQDRYLEVHRVEETGIGFRVSKELIKGKILQKG